MSVNRAWEMTVQSQRLWLDLGQALLALVPREAQVAPRMASLYVLFLGISNAMTPSHSNIFYNYQILIILVHGS